LPVTATVRMVFLFLPAIFVPACYAFARD